MYNYTLRLCKLHYPLKRLTHQQYCCLLTIKTQKIYVCDLISLFSRLPRTSYLKMIDLWFIALMLIPTNEVILHCIGYLSRIKVNKDSKVEPKPIKVNVNSRVTTVNYPYTPPSKENWKEISKDSKSDKEGQCLKKIRMIRTILSPILFVIFLVSFICVGILLKYKKI